ncbi:MULTISPECIES: alpha/beta hydrolase [Aerococcus]|uniref:Alpha/beta hydrolase n=1 Tax=Aerococcus sanguinicola TaxID=119206 RepID=A0A5N1GPQ5_9LACT|nr:MULTISPECIES: alpha/beta hydrolase [Aerococcus]KAA9302374.1 alpha/beta hydrolase [Aerococcus sanguinicola]MDK6369746.1 alpha/beta hydrolase [Aerococcus sp. UMB9870]MDK6680386.1 alpha/beta hydrolase [Aerococcus sp. UMB8608]MDK6687117.1 alpha/beta hydrolase [Aerococcus sp. UMB8623]MDK6940336.1 alpha/beta hydrolase [Aerococcus sp. UMB8487]
MNRRKKRSILYGLVIVLVLLGLSTFAVGSYFVNYALVPQQGAENRQEKLAPSPGQLAIDQARAREERARQDWLDHLGKRRQPVSIQSADGLRLYGHQIKQEGAKHRWVIIVHGYQSSEDESNLLARHFDEAGYNVLTYNQRAHAPSQGDYIGMGYLEKDDLLAWTKWLAQEDPQAEIVYHGTSMGGATVLMASGLALPKQVKAIISDCAYSSTWEIFASELKWRFNLPAFPVLYMAEVMGRLQAGYDIRWAEPRDYVAKSHLPILFIHTETDDFVPVEMARELYAYKKQGPKALYLLPEGGHAEAKFQPAYYQQLEDFLADYLSPSMD